MYSFRKDILKMSQAFKPNYSKYPTIGPTRKTKPYILYCILLGILSIALVFINMFFFSFPEWITIIFAALIVIITLVLWARSKRSGAVKVLISVLNVAAILITLFGAYCNPYWNNLVFRVNGNYFSKPYDETVTGKQAKQDLDYAMHYLKKLHPALINGLPSDIEEKYKQVSEELLQYDTITVNDLSGRIQQVFSLLSDGHTFAADNCPERHYLKYIPSHNAAGDKLISVNGKTIDELFREKSYLYSYEAESYGLTLMKDDLETLEGLDFLGLNVEDGVTFTYETAAGTPQGFIFYPSDFLTYDAYKAYNNISDSSESDSNSFVRYEIQEEKSLAVLTLDSCNYNADYINCVKEMFTEVKALGIKNVCVDLRSNSGGNSLVANEFLKYLNISSYGDTGMVWRLGFLELPFSGGETVNERYDDLIFEGNVYVLSSYYTFSSAMMFVQYITDNDLGTVIGEPPGNDPNGYGEIAIFKCPNSEIAFQVSTKKWVRIDMEKTEKLIQPDAVCDSESAMDKLYQIMEVRG